MKYILWAAWALVAVGCGGGGSGGAPPPQPPPPPAAPFGLDVRPAVADFDLPIQPPQSGTFDLVEAFANLSFSAGIFLAGVPGDTRVAMLEQGGRVWAFEPVATATQTSRRLVLDLSQRVVFSGEQGLLGLAFDPAFRDNRYFYVHYSQDNPAPRRSVIARFTWSTSTDSAALSSEKIILVQQQPAANHNGGAMAFGADGFLYIAFGDGGGSNDQFHNGQNLGTWLGSVLRINVHPQNQNDAYDVPADNPFISRVGARPEIWAFGLRNPFRFSFDRQNGDLWLGDVGQNQYEEIDLIERGRNYGWNAFEGNHVFAGGDPLAAGTVHTPPVHEYSHTDGIAVIGGYVYRGSRFASLFGRYLFADYGSGQLWQFDASDATPVVTELAIAQNPTSFGENDDNGEVYVVQQNGTILEFAESGTGGSLPTALSATGLFTDMANLTPASGLIEYDLNHPFWSDGALKRRWIAVPAGQRIGFSATGSWTFPIGTVIVKHFEIQLTEGNPSSARRLETRILIRGNGEWFGFTYRWNAQETDALLLAGAESELLTIQVPGGAPRVQQYDYPSRTDCLQCHTQAAGFVLGVRTRQVNREFALPLATDNQLRTYDHINLFTSSIGAATQYGAYAAIDDAAAAISTRARTYLDVNCAQCHRPGGGTPVNLDLRFDTPDANMNAIDVAPSQGSLGIAGARIIDQGNKETSVLWERMRRLDGNRMPPIASHVVDEEGTELVGAWIDAL